ncbi:MAG: S-layer homology domain-containing protein, partial [Oscillospiraceae bacterium]|nr:S-layer homology domain-containing protein [Oscillospiraceae bacterium]
RAQVVTFLHRAEGSPAPISPVNPFTDVKKTDFFYTPVLWAVHKGITNGVSQTTFGSFTNCNRAAVVTFLWRTAGSPEPRTNRNPFTDVKKTDFFYKPVLWAVENGITAGLTATEFGPGTNCNRAQVVTFLYRAYN